jgi:TonB family protein
MTDAKQVRATTPARKAASATTARAAAALDVLASGMSAAGMSAAGRADNAPLPEGTTAPRGGADGTKPAAAPAARSSLFGILDADQRIRANAENSERTVWISAAAITLLYVSMIASQLFLGAPLMTAEQRERERRGQDAPGSISVEIVAEPDMNAKTNKWRDGTETQAPQPSDQPPQPPQMASREQPEIKAEETQTEQEEREKEKDGEQAKSNDAMLLDIESLVDAAAADLTRKIDRAFAQRPQRQQPQRQAIQAGGQMKVRGRGASGKSDAFTRSVIAALMKTRPGPFAMWGNVLVSFEIGQDGKLRYVRVLDSSGNTALDDAAVAAIRKAHFERPPPGLSAQERTYIIDYVFGFG